MKKALTIVFLILFNPSLFALTNGGERPTISPSWFKTLEDEILIQAKLVNTTSEDVKKANTQPGFFGGASEYDKGMKNLEEQIDKLRNMLSSPSKNFRKKYEKIIISENSTINEYVKTSNNEIIEIFNAMENARSLINVIQNKLKADSKNYAKAIEQYEVYRTCLFNISKMNEEFISKGEPKYRTLIDSHISQVTKQKDDVNNILRSNNVSQATNKALLEGTIENLNALLRSLNEAKNTLNKQKEWVEMNLKKLRENLSIIEVTIKTINVTKDRTAIEKTINDKNYLSISCTLPPFIEF